MRNFKVIINGKSEEITRVKQISTGYNHETFTDTEYWFTWKMHFPSKETVFVENYYTGSYSYSAGGLYFVSYIIGTGSTWQGSIKDGRVVFNHSNLATNYFINDTFPGYTNIKPAYYQDSVVYAFTKYRPKESEVLIVEFYPYWANSNIYEFKEYLEKNNYTKKELRLMRNEIFARRGYVFNDKSLNKYFTSKKWYKPNNNFKASMLNEYEQNMINYLSQLEKEANK